MRKYTGPLDNEDIRDLIKKEIESATYELRLAISQLELEVEKLKSGLPSEPPDDTGELTVTW
jgi:hypothetical protein